jgi:hypothetical protein
MNREDIIKMAREAGLTGLMEDGLVEYFERFAALVAAAEREACAVLVERGMGDWLLGKKVAKAIRERGNT